MKKAEMKCRTCLIFNGHHCVLDPEWWVIEKPDEHYCSRGEWNRFWWGDWEDEA